jgi:hypothetical protein
LAGPSSCMESEETKPRIFNIVDNKEPVGSILLDLADQFSGHGGRME